MTRRIEFPITYNHVGMGDVEFYDRTGYRICKLNPVDNEWDDPPHPDVMKQIVEAANRGA